MPGKEASVSCVFWCSWSNITWVCAYLGFTVHTLLLLWNGSYCCRQQSLQAFEGGLKGCKDEEFNIMHCKKHLVKMTTSEGYCSFWVH